MSMIQYEIQERVQASITRNGRLIAVATTVDDARFIKSALDKERFDAPDQVADRLYTAVVDYMECPCPDHWQNLQDATTEAGHVFGDTGEPGDPGAAADAGEP